MINNNDPSDGLLDYLCINTRSTGTTGSTGTTRLEKMNSIPYLGGDLRYILNPEYSDWRCEMTSNFYIQPLMGQEPNWFWRKMQYLVFGFKWKKIEK